LFSCIVFQDEVKTCENNKESKEKEEKRKTAASFLDFIHGIVSGLFLCPVYHHHFTFLSEWADTMLSTREEENNKRRNESPE